MIDHHATPVALALGSNIGDCLHSLRKSVKALAPYVDITATSPIYETAPLYVTDQPVFLNAVVVGTTKLDPLALLRLIKELEVEIGRLPSFQWGPRLIDIDIIFYGDSVVETPELTIPHPRLTERDFVLRPLSDIAPKWRHPQNGNTVVEMLANLPPRSMICLGPIHLLNHPSIMGIINITPDSFSGDGLLLHDDYVARAVALAAEMKAEGADILDIGGESSRPDSTPISAEEEIRRVVPIIAAIKKELGSIPIAVDTWKAEVAEQSLRAGASIVNDIKALSGDTHMGEVVARFGATVVLMHNQAEQGAVIRDAKIGGQYEAPEYGDVVADVAQALKTRVDVALAVGVARDKIILDPGIGFGKTPQQNLALIAQLGRIKALGFPVLMGLSRKSFIGHVLNLPVEERLEGTAAGVAVSVMQGADILRVHDVKFMARVVKMAAALKDAAD